jgi:hypothetical protein
MRVLVMRMAPLVVAVELALQGARLVLRWRELALELERLALLGVVQLVLQELALVPSRLVRVRP